jgi:hypothetical protein
MSFSSSDMLSFPNASSPDDDSRETVFIIG